MYNTTRFDSKRKGNPYAYSIVVNRFLLRMIFLGHSCAILIGCYPIFHVGNSLDDVILCMNLTTTVDRKTKISRDSSENNGVTMNEKNETDVKLSSWLKNSASHGIEHILGS